MKDIIGRRIKEERTRQNLTQEELIAKAQLAWERQTLGQIEKGERELKAWELAKIAKVLHVELPVFFPETVSPATPPKPVVLWREKPENHEHLEAEFIRLCKDFKFVETLNSVDSSRFTALPRKKIDLNTFTYNDAYALAEEVRGQLGVGDYPATSLVKILEEKYGIKFFFNELGGNGSAAASASEYGLCILISSSEPAWRQHFSIAHELFHIITWDDALIEQIKDDQTLRSLNEKLANAFAAGLLVPTESLRREIRSLAKPNAAGIVSIARQFEVSLEALLWRMASIHIIRRDDVQKALQDPGLRSLDYASRMESQSPYYLSNRFVRLAYLACENGEISRARLAKMLNQSLSALADYLKNFGLAEVSNNEITISNS